MKDKLRKEIIHKRNDLDFNQVEHKSDLIIERIVKLLKEKEYKNILIFMNMNNEVMASKLLKYDFNFFITKTMPKSILYINRYVESELVKHPFGYYESTSTDYIDPKVIDVSIVPGLAFDEQGNRLGYGMGYYDRLLHDYPLIKRIGVCYDFQIVDNVPIDEYDQVMDYIISEKQLIKIARN